MAFGQLVPGMAPMPIPQMQAGGSVGDQGMSLLKAALAMKKPGAQPGMQPGAPMSILPPGGQMGLLGSLMAKLQPQANAGPDLGGMGPAPNSPGMIY